MVAYSLLLFLHLLAVGIAFGAAALIHSGLVRMRAASRIPQAREALRLCETVARTMPIVALVLLATGAYMTHVRWSWTTPWIDVAIAGLVVMQGIAGAVLKPRTTELKRSLEQAGDGDVTPALAAAIRHRALWMGAQVQPFLATGIMYVMVMKPGLAGGAAALSLAAMLAALSTMAPRRAALAASPRLDGAL